MSAGAAHSPSRRSARTASDLRRISSTDALPGRPEPVVGGRHDLHPDLVRLPLPGRGAGRLQPQGGGLVHGREDDGQPRGVGAEHGAAHPQAGIRDPPFRPGQPIYKSGVRQSVPENGRAALDGNVGDAYDNAMAESFFATLECELLDRRSWKSKTEARTALFTCSRAGTTPAACTRRWGISHQSRSRRNTARTTNARPKTGYPPRRSVRHKRRPPPWITPLCGGLRSKPIPARGMGSSKSSTTPSR